MKPETPLTPTDAPAPPSAARTEEQALHGALAEPDAVRAQAESSAARVDAVLEARSRSWLARLFPDAVDREVRQHQLAELQCGFEFRRRALQMAVETKLQAVEEMCNHVLVTGKSEVRRRRQEVFAEQRLKLQASLDALADRFHADMERRFEALEGMRNAILREREARRLERSVDEFHATLDQLAADFVAIIQEGVQR